MTKSKVIVKIHPSSEMATVYNTGLMVLTTKDSGNSIKRKVKVSSGMLKETCTEVNSETIWPMAMVNTHISMDPNIKESSQMTYKKVTVKKNGLMEQSILAHIKMV